MSKIIFYIDMMYRGGAQRVMANLIDYFYSKGYETVLINDFVQDDNKPQYTLPNGIKRVYLRQKLGGNKIIKNISRIIVLRRVIKEEKPDVVLSFLGRPNKRMLIATIGLKIRKVVSVRNDPNREYGNSKFRKWSTGQLFKLADGCVFQTEEASEYFPEPVRNKSTIILNPVDKKFYNVERSKNPRNIVTVGRMEPQKNQKMLIDAFAVISGDYPNEDLIIYGDGPMRSELEEYAAERGVKNRVHFPGNVEDVEKRLADAKIFVLPSDYEGLPNALMEAMAVGVPSISTDCPCGGPRMLIKCAEVGLLVEVGNPEDLIEKLRSLISNDRRQEQFSSNEKKYAQIFQAVNIYEQWESYTMLDAK